MEMREAVIVEAVRTPVGRYGGVLKDVRPDDMAALVIGEVVERSGIDPEILEDVLLGDSNQAGEDNRDVARMASLLADFPVEVAGCTVNRLCGSGLEAVNQAAMAIKTGMGDVFVAGGTESMSRAPLVLAGGLTPVNVAEAIRIVHPAAVDTASGVENRPGHKDPDALTAFVQAARLAF